MVLVTYNGAVTFGVAPLLFKTDKNNYMNNMNQTNETVQLADKDPLLNELFNACSAAPTFEERSKFGRAYNRRLDELRKERGEVDES